MLTLTRESAPVPAGGKRRVRDAISALRALLKDPNDTAQGFRLLEALDPLVHHRELARMRTAPSGLKLLADQPVLLSLLRDTAMLDALPEGSVGHAYRAFCKGEGIGPDGFVQVGEAGSEADQLEDEQVRYAALRHRDSHDLWHVVYGCRADLLGEAAILGFTLGQTRSPGMAILLLGGLMHSLSIGWRQGACMRRLAWRGLQHGLAARPLAPVPWEEWLARPLADVRAELGITEVPSYTPTYAARYS
ncbi:MAG TPA: Coq4 family protein [Polyangiales bacterium]|nr:Coq4 family protein [Polyangiales bacterium]